MRWFCHAANMDTRIFLSNPANRMHGRPELLKEDKGTETGKDAPRDVGLIL